MDSSISNDIFELLKDNVLNVEDIELNKKNSINSFWVFRFFRSDYHITKDRGKV